jgi:HEAT repeat protein
MTARLRLLLAIAVCLASVGPSDAGDPLIDSPMYRDPVLYRAKVVYVFNKGLIPLWREALEHAGADIPCQAALAVVAAHRQGLHGLEVLQEPLIHALTDPNRHPTVRLAAARALIELNAQASAPSLFRQVEGGDADLCALIEPALARWDYKPARKLWLARLTDPPPGGQALIRAIRCLGAVHATEATKALHELLFSANTSVAIQLEAARALGAIQTSGAEADARRLLAAGEHNTLRRLVAAALLRYHTEHDAISILQQLLADPEPAVVRIAVERLTAIDPESVLPALVPLLHNRDVEVRLDAMRVLVREITLKRLPLLAARCNDVHPKVRVQARLDLHTLAARPDYHGPVITLASRLLNGKDWRGQEQAALLLAQLGHQPAAKRLLTLLNSNRPEVCLAAAWGLRRLADPETLPAVYAYVRALHQDIFADENAPGSRRSVANVFDEQLSQLIQFLGKSRYGAAEKTLRILAPKASKGVPRPPVGAEARAAAIWALGLLHENKPDPAVTAIIEKPLKDILAGPNFDYPSVFRMCIIALARMRSPGALGLVSQFYHDKKPSLSPTNNAAGWAIEHLTGKPVPHEATIVRTRGGWFLRPSTP